MKISKTFTFEAAHRLHLLPKTHQCSNLHGHSYSITVVIKQKSLDDSYLLANATSDKPLTEDDRILIRAEHAVAKAPGFVLDYGDLSIIKNYIDEYLDHSVLVAIPPVNAWKNLFSNMKLLKKAKGLSTYEEVANFYGFSLRNIKSTIETQDKLELMDLDLGDYELLKVVNSLNSKSCVLPVMQTTCELMSVYFKGKFAELLEKYQIPRHCISVSISETPKTNAVTGNLTF